MKRLSLVTIQSSVLVALVSFGFALTVHAAAPATTTITFPPSTATGPDYNTVRAGCSAGSAKDCKLQEAMEQNVIGDSQTQRRCDDANKTYKEDLGKLKSCPGFNCITKVQKCMDEDSFAGAQEANAGSFDLSACTDIVSTACKENNAGTLKTFTQDKKDAERDQKDAKKTLEDIQKEGTDMQKTARDAAQIMSDDADKADTKLRDTQQQATEKLQAIIQGAEAAKQKAYDDAQAVFNKIDENYVAMRDAARRTTSNLAAAQRELTVQCNAYADTKYRAAEAELQKRIDTEAAQVRNYAFTSQAGAKNRVKKKQLKNLEANFAGFFSDCINGVEGPGASVLANIAKMKNTQQDDIAKLKDEEARMENLRKQALQKLQRDEANADQAKTSAQSSIATQMSNIQQDYVKALQRSQTNYTNAMTDLQNQQQLLQQRMTTAGQELNKANNEVLLDQTRMNCSQANGGGVSESSANRKLKNYENVSEALSSFQNSCRAVKQRCCNSETYSRAPTKTEADNMTSGGYTKYDCYVVQQKCKDAADKQDDADAKSIGIDQ